MSMNYDAITASVDYVDGQRRVFLDRVPDKALIDDEIAINADPDVVQCEYGDEVKFTFRATNGVAVYKATGMDDHLRHICELESWTPSGASA